VEGRVVYIEGQPVKTPVFTIGDPLRHKMGACMSAESSEEFEKKKRSKAIDARLEEDSRRLRKECKILLLGESCLLCLLHQVLLTHHSTNHRQALERVASRLLSSR
jgi:hypothetical protein